MCAELEELRDENRRLERDFTSMEQSLRERINMLEVKANCNRHLASPPTTAPCKKVTIFQLLPINSVMRSYFLVHVHVYVKNIYSAILKCRSSKSGNKGFDSGKSSPQNASLDLSTPRQGKITRATYGRAFILK